MIGFRICTRMRGAIPAIFSPLTALFHFRTALQPVLICSLQGASRKVDTRLGRMHASYRTWSGSSLGPFPLFFASGIPIVRLPSCDDGECEPKCLSMTTPTSIATPLALDSRSHVNRASCSTPCIRISRFWSIRISDDRSWFLERLRGVGSSPSTDAFTCCEFSFAHSSTLSLFPPSRLLFGFCDLEMTPLNTW